MDVSENEDIIGTPSLDRDESGNFAPPGVCVVASIPALLRRA
jgi:hypothetical protein